MNKTLRIVACAAAAWLAVLLPLSSAARVQESSDLADSIAARRLTLPEAVSLALQNNREILMAQVAVSRAEAGHQEAQAVFRPQVLLGSGLAATRGFPLSIEGSAPSIFQVATSQALFNPSLRNLEKQAAEMQLSAEQSLEQKRDEMVTRTILTYLDLDRSRRSLDYAQGQARSLEAAAGIMQERLEAGLETPVEATRARLNAARARQQLVALENRIGMLAFTLRDLTGIPQSQAVLTEQTEVPATEIDEPLERWIARALDSNPGIKAVEQEIRGLEFRVRSEQATRWPRVNLVGQYGLFSDINNFSDFFQRFERNNATFGVSIVVPLYDRARHTAQLSKAEAELADARYRLAAARAGLERQVRELWAAIEQQGQGAGREVVRLELDLARRSLDAQLALYEQGRVNRLAVEQARFAENESWVRFFEAAYREDTARLELLRLTGQIRSLFP